MAKIVIVEGVDRVGKSTFIEKFVKKADGFKPFKHKPSDFHYQDMDNENETDKMLQLLEMVKLLDGNVVFDRFHLSNLVYGFIDRDYNPFTAAYSAASIDTRIIELFGDDALLVYVRPEDLNRSSKEHGSDLSEYLESMDIASIDCALPMIVCEYSTLDVAVDAAIDYFEGLWWL